MFCPNCGAQLPDGAAFCSVCGQPQQKARPAYQQPQQNYQQPQQNYQQPYYQQPQQNYQQPYYQPQQNYRQPVYQQLPMKWHKFLCYFSLWLSAVLNIVFGFLYLSEEASLVDAYVPELETPNGVYGIFAILIGILCAVTAILLLKFKKNGPRILHFTLLNSAVGNVVIMVWVALILSGYGADATVLYVRAGITLVASLIVIALNKTYYNKRAHLFVR
ncbi:MAG: zinc ribbon domain-containing protein [Lachnospiraceae bacterium]|nr:zinc ribbon domain-containing protein [Lachnospiraceae bacterium]